MDNRPIGVFDSGLGGLTVVKELKKYLPNESIMYFGDTARIPYGTRSPETVTKYSIQCIRFLSSMNIKIIVVACNTASSTSLDIVQKMFDFQIIGVINPGAEAALKATNNNKIGIIGTEGTIRSRAYSKTIGAKNPNIKIYEKSCFLFVPIVEEGWSDTDIAYLTAQRYLDKMKSVGVDTLVLGCTHYPLLTNTIARVMGPEVTLVNPAEGTAREVKKILEQRDMMKDLDMSPEYKFFVSDFGQKFKIIGSRFLNHNIKYDQKVDIDNF